MRIAKLRLRDPVGQILQKVLGFFGLHAGDRLGLGLVKPHGPGAGLRVDADQGMHRLQALMVEWSFAMLIWHSA